VLSTAVRVAAAGVAAGVLPVAGAVTAPSFAYAGPASRSADLLKVAISGDPGNLHPWLANGVPQWSTFWPTIYESLLWRDGDMNLTGHLVERWEVAGADIKLFLRRGITYHNGRPFDADSVRYAFEQITSASSRSLWKGFMSPVQRTSAQDSHTVTLHLDQPTRAVLSNLVLISAIEPNHARTVGDRIAVQPVGTGPYKFVEYVPGTHLIVEANPSYWGPKPKINRIQFRWIRDDSTRIAALEAGEAHIVNNVPPDAIARIEGNSRLRVLTSSTTRVMFFSFRADRPPFSDKRVRQALNYAIDRQAIVRNILGGRAGQVITGPVHPSVLGGDVQVPQYTYDPQKARALLREAGASGAKVLLGAPNGRYINDKQVAEAVLGYLQGVGLDASLELREFSTYIGDVQRGQQTRWDLYMLGIAPPSFDADFLRDQWTPPGSTRWNGYSNPQINKMYEDSSLISDRRIARLALHKVLAAIWDDPPWLFMYYQNSVDAVDRRVTGFRTLPDEFLRFAPADLPA
jgi:peptide/nickel transport system substrate-binding protein